MQLPELSVQICIFQYFTFALPLVINYFTFSIIFLPFSWREAQGLLAECERCSYDVLFTLVAMATDVLFTGDADSGALDDVIAT